MTTLTAVTTNYRHRLPHVIRSYPGATALKTTPVGTRFEYAGATFEVQVDAVDDPDFGAIVTMSTVLIGPDGMTAGVLPQGTTSQVLLADATSHGTHQLVHDAVTAAMSAVADFTQVPLR